MFIVTRLFTYGLMSLGKELETTVKRTEMSSKVCSSCPWGGQKKAYYCQLQGQAQSFLDTFQEAFLWETSSNHLQKFSSSTALRVNFLLSRGLSNLQYHPATYLYPICLTEVQLDVDIVWSVLLPKLRGHKSKPRLKLFLYTQTSSYSNTCDSKIC